MAKKQTDTTDKKRTTKVKATKRSKISWIIKPDGMSLAEWQIALRKQIAQEEHFGISCVDDKLLPGEYSVNPLHRGCQSRKRGWRASCHQR